MMDTTIIDVGRTTGNDFIMITKDTATTPVIDTQKVIAAISLAGALFVLSVPVCVACACHRRRAQKSCAAIERGATTRVAVKCRVVGGEQEENVMGIGLGIRLNHVQTAQKPKIPALSKTDNSVLKLNLTGVTLDHTCDWRQSAPAQTTAPAGANPIRLKLEHATDYGSYDNVDYQRRDEGALSLSGHVTHQRWLMDSINALPDLSPERHTLQLEIPDSAAGNHDNVSTDDLIISGRGPESSCTSGRGSETSWDSDSNDGRDDMGGDKGEEASVDLSFSYDNPCFQGIDGGDSLNEGSGGDGRSCLITDLQDGNPPFTPNESEM